MRINHIISMPSTATAETFFDSLEYPTDKAELLTLAEDADHLDPELFNTLARLPEGQYFSPADIYEGMTLRE